MKNKMLKTKILLSGLLVALATVVRAGSNDLTAALQRGLFEEEANHNLPAAIQAYQSVIAQFDKDRKLAATAVFRLGECYRKQGSTNEAAAQYERIVREFADQAPLVELSRQRLPAQAAQAALAAGQRAGTEEQKRLLDEEIKLAEQKLAEQQQAVNVGTLPPEALLDTQRDILELKLTAAALNAGQRAATDEQKRLLDEEIKLVEKQLVAHESRLQNGVGDQNALRTAQRELLELKRRKAALEAGQPVSLAAGQPAASEEQKRLLDEEIKLVEHTLASQRQAQQMGAMPSDATVPTERDLLELKLRKAALAGGQPVSLAAAPPAATSAELEEVARIQEMVRNSPDLINAPIEDGLTPLVKAASHGELMVVQCLVKGGADVNLRCRAGSDTALGEAAGHGHLAIVKLLLERGAAVAAADFRGETPLHRAADAGFKSVVEALLAAKADVNAREEGGLTPLHFAALEGFKGVAEVLLAAKADVNARDKRGDTPLHWAAAFGRPALLELLLAHKAEVNIKNTGSADPGNSSNAPNSPRRTSGATPLVTAILGKHVAVVKLLLAAKAEVNFACAIATLGRQGTEWGSPLHFAVDVNSPEIVTQLLDHGANPNAEVAGPGESAAGLTPLRAAVLHDQTEMVQLLLARKADPNIPDGEGKTPLHWAAIGHAKELVKVLLANHAEVNRQDQSGRTPLSYSGCRPTVKASQLAQDQSRKRPLGYSDTDIAAVLLGAKADPNIPDGEGKTSLHWAVLGQSVEVVKLLLANHAEINRQDTAGWTPLGDAVMISDRAVAAALLDAKADPNLKQMHGQTALHYAVGVADGHGSKEMTELLLAKGADPNLRNDSGNTPLAVVKSASGRIATIPGAGTPAAAQLQREIAELLRQHGAIEELPRMDVIEVRRPSANFSEGVFTKGTNDYNHFNLFEAIAAHYGFVTAKPGIDPRGTYEMSPWRRQGSLAFPDLRSITVHHPTEDGLNWTVIHFNLGDALQRRDSDVGRLAWGDVVEVPEADHPINAVWQGLPEQMLANLKQRVERRVQLTVKGQTTNLLLSLQTTAPPGFLHSSEGLGSATPPTFLLQPVLYGSGLLRASSDLSRVTVKRQDATTGQTYELLFDCSGPRPGPDFWLRNGDAIEVPEKP